MLSFSGGTGGTASGADPFGSLLASGSTLYGMTTDGPAVGGNCNFFSVGTNGTNFQNLVSFTGTGGTASGRQPYGSLILSSTRLYGMTSAGGVDSVGNIFSVGIDGSGYQDLYDFTGGTDGANPDGDLLASGGTLFGMTKLRRERTTAAPPFSPLTVPAHARARHAGARRLRRGGGGCVSLAAAAACPEGASVYPAKGIALVTVADPISRPRRANGPTIYLSG